MFISVYSSNFKKIKLKTILGLNKKMLKENHNGIVTYELTKPLTNK